MASKNTQDGSSLVTTAEGGMQEIDNMVQRIRELAVQASNDTNDYASNDRTKIQNEIDQLTAGIDGMAKTVEFNKKVLLDGSLMDDATRNSLLAEVNFKLKDLAGTSVNANVVGVSKDQYTKNFQNSAVNVKRDGLAGGRIGKLWSEEAVSFTFDKQTVTRNQGKADSYVFEIAGTSATDLAVSDMTSADAFDKYVAKLDSAIGTLKQMKDAGADVASDLETVSKAKEAATEVYAANELTKGLYRSASGLSETEGSGLFFQTGANSAQGMNVGLGAMTSKVLGIGDGAGNAGINVNQNAGLPISNTIDTIDTALQYVASQRATMGAVANRLEYTQKAVDISSENLSASESRIRDADMAKEMMNFTKANVLQQAGISMMGQANQAPQSILSLLG
jgi:flagellin